MKLFKKNKNYNIVYRLKLIATTLGFFTLGFLADKDLTTFGFIVFGVIFLITFIHQLKLIRLEKYIPKVNL